MADVQWSRRRRTPSTPARPSSRSELRTAVLEGLAEATANDVTTIAELASSGGGMRLDSVVACSVLSSISVRYGIRFDMKRMRPEDCRTAEALVQYVQHTAFLETPS